MNNGQNIFLHLRLAIKLFMKYNCDNYFSTRKDAHLIFLRLFSGWFVQILPFACLCFQPFMGKLRFSVKKTQLL